MKMNKEKKKIFNLADYIIFAIAAFGCFLGFKGISAESIITTLIYISCGVIVYMISEEIGMGAAKSKLCAYAAITMPVGFYCQFILDKSMAFMLFCVLFGFYFWLKENDRLFLIFFMAAFLFGGIALPVFITLLFLKKKNGKDILLNVLLFVIPAAVVQIIKNGLPDFHDLKVYGAVFMIGGLSINITLCIIVFIAAYAYTKEPGSKKDSVKWGLYLISLQMFALFGLCGGNFKLQQILIMAPFLTLSAFINNDTKIFMALDILLMLFFVLFAVNKFCGYADETLFVNGIFSNRLGNGIINKVQMRDFLLFTDIGVILSFFSVLLLIMAVFKHPKYDVADFGADIQKGTVGFVRTRFIAGIAIFLLPALFCFISAFNPPYVTLYTPDVYGDVSYMVSGRCQAEVFAATKGKLESVSFRIGTYDRENDVNITVRISDATTSEIKFETEINAQGYKDCDWVYIDTKGLVLERWNIYRLDIVCNDAPDASHDCITLYRTEDLEEQTHAYAFIDGVRQEYHLCVKIVEDYLSPEEAE